MFWKVAPHHLLTRSPTTERPCHPRQSHAPVLKPMEDRKRGELSHERITSSVIRNRSKRHGVEATPPLCSSRDDHPRGLTWLSYRPLHTRLAPRQRVLCNKTLKEACLWGELKSAMCVQRFDDSLNSAIRITYRISLRSSSLREPRYPLLTVV